MATQTETKTVSKATVSNYEFAVEADERRNGDIKLQALSGVTLRGRISASKPIIADPKQNLRDFEKTIPGDQGEALGALPNIPGEIIYVNPTKCTYRIEDPLRDDKEMCNRISAAIKARGGATSQIVGRKPREGKIDVDSMKTLCRELRWFVDSGDARPVPASGDIPTLEECDKLKGDYLQNPGSVTQNMQPRYEKDMEDWVQNLARTGG